RLLLGDWTGHSLRHRFASAAYAVDRDLRAVQELLGHSKPETTARYVATPDGALRAAVAGVTAA
ncbi:MAG TPA: site-specific integrase, partial [Kribbella sp.]|uniref:site-specific integrase n=1 Tax=Kribbella sp. TaxID=1871183 RepID=UPI002D799FAB